MKSSSHDERLLSFDAFDIERNVSEEGGVVDESAEESVTEESQPSEHPAPPNLAGSGLDTASKTDTEKEPISKDESEADEESGPVETVVDAQPAQGEGTESVDEFATEAGPALIGDSPTEDKETEPVDELVTEELVAEEEATNELVVEEAAANELVTEEEAANELATEEEAGSAEGSPIDGQDGVQDTVESELLADQIQTTAIFVENGAVNPLDTDQIYQFSIAESGVFTAQLSELTGDADVQLIADRNQNGVVDQGEILAWQWERGTSSESIRRFIDAGDYLVRVKSHQESTASYQLSTDFTASATDELSFSINLNLRGLDGLNEQAQAGIYRAAEYWENVITHSSLGRAQVVNINIFGTNTHPDGLEATEELPYLALGGPQSYLGDTNNRLISSSGYSLVNLFYEDDYNQTPTYLEEIMRHEFGHVLGLGTNWLPRHILVGGEPLVVNDFVDLDNQTYRAETYAGQAYGELIGELQAPIPLDSVHAHWSESALDRELMTPRAEGIGERLPVSPITIASLRDIGWNVNFGAAEVSTLSALVPLPETIVA